MIDRTVEVEILAEDERAVNFLRRYVARAVNVNPRNIRPSICQEGSGEQHVRQSYPDRVKGQRHDCTFRKVSLLVHLDADLASVQGKLQLLAETLKNAKLSARTSHERIAIAIPKRNIETWIHGLGGMSLDLIDEAYDFKKDPERRVATNDRQRERACGERIRPAFEKLFQLTRRNAGPPPQQMPSVASAIEELQRLER